MGMGLMKGNVVASRIFKTGPGWVGIAGSETGLCRLSLPVPNRVEAGIRLGRDIPASGSDAPFLMKIEEIIQRYFAGERVDFRSIAVDLSCGTEFQRKVWETIRQIEYGQTRSYSWVAVQTGNPAAVRAAGNAIGRNPVPVIIPCHRVLHKDGGLGGFGGGIEMKRHLLELEK
jgi:methylated-DNA-[protein]-cysteine S-methyltransferase